MTIAKQIASILNLPQTTTSARITISANNPDSVYVEAEIIYARDREIRELDFIVTKYEPFDLSDIDAK